MRRQVPGHWRRTRRTARCVRCPVRLNAFSGGVGSPSPAPTPSKHDADINFSSPDDAWWTSERWSISDVMARAREIEDLGYVSLFHGDA